ncbi:MAG: hypothetical protein HQL22_04330 [Candidatus Omnitrophica bacterium]|nr:hypothetical protein [Candidatus Omnitrophota bacterium]
MTEKRAFELIAASLEKLRKSGMLSAGAAVKSDTILLGIGSPLDSIGFVTFVTDLEERVSTETGRELYLVLNEINEFNINQPNLKVEALARYVVTLSAR